MSSQCPCLSRKIRTLGAKVPSYGTSSSWSKVFQRVLSHALVSTINYDHGAPEVGNGLIRGVQRACAIQEGMQSRQFKPCRLLVLPVGVCDAG